MDPRNDDLRAQIQELEKLSKRQARELNDTLDDLDRARAELKAASMTPEQRRAQVRRWTSDISKLAPVAALIGLVAWVRQQPPQAITVAVMAALTAVLIIGPHRLLPDPPSPPSAKQAEPSVRPTEPAVVPSPTATSSPTPTATPTRTPQNQDVAVVPQARNGVPVAGSPAPGPGPPGDDPEEPGVRETPGPDETARPTPQPTPSPTESPKPTPSPSPSPSPTPTPTEPPDVPRRCLIFIEIPRLLELCLFRLG